ncbi:hypothetical protein DF3PA_70117 [Candidatus Defluviicoccus seviourii]|uniref:Uncharacterized protein n=1 Tax=Candidatus Defluviicoccus seviourii TaxID=2565273 RepID=A0A564WH69_9PROT|nr:hypothetical protein DF3PA_70117 [Candidatus Defluviicoccus seviourii]
MVITGDEVAKRPLRGRRSNPNLLNTNMKHKPTKHCVTCNTPLPPHHSKLCGNPECELAWHRHRYHTEPDRRAKQMARSRAWQQEHKEEVAIIVKRYYDKNRERYREYNRAKYHRNKDEGLDVGRERKKVLCEA